MTALTFNQNLIRMPNWPPKALADEAGRDLSEKVSEVLKQNLGIRSDRIFEKVWDQAYAAGRFGPNFNGQLSNPLSDPSFEKIEAALRETLVYCGKGIETEVKGPNPQIDQLFRFLIHGEKPSDWLNIETAKGILLKKNPELLEEMRQEFRALFNACGERFPEVGSREEAVYKTFIGNLVALLPYSYPEIGEVFSLPQKIDGKWKNVSYTVDRKIELSPKWLSSPFSALGLVSKEGPPLLVFLGTTYPTGDGYLATLLSDFTPLLSVGQAPYLYGREEFEEWLKDKEKVRLCGTSLGGALAFHVLCNHKDKIAQVDSYNPAGLYPWLWKETYDRSVEINIIYNEGDLVSTLGFYPEGSGVRVLRPVLPQAENWIKAHAGVYTGHPEVTLLESDPVYENSRICRKLLTAFHFLFGFILAFLPILCAYLVYLLLNTLILQPLNCISKKI